MVDVKSRSFAHLYQRLASALEVPCWLFTQEQHPVPWGSDERRDQITGGKRGINYTRSRTENGSSIDPPHGESQGIPTST